MKTLWVRIGSVDMFGYNGRDLHPTEEMEGQIGRVAKVTVQEFEAEPLDDEDVYLVRMADGTMVEFMESEIAAISFDEKAL